MQRAIALGIAAIALLATGCGGGGGERARPNGENRPLTVWILEDQPDRVSAARADVARFARRTRREVKLVPLGDDQIAPRMAAAVRDGTLPDAVQLPMANARAYARQGLGPAADLPQGPLRRASRWRRARRTPSPRRRSSMSRWRPAASSSTAAAR